MEVALKGLRAVERSAIRLAVSRAEGKMEDWGLAVVEE